MGDLVELSEVLWLTLADPWVEKHGNCVLERHISGLCLTTLLSLPLYFTGSYCHGVPSPRLHLLVT